MATNMNIHTGDKMMTKPPSKAYADGWDRVFSSKGNDMKKSPKKEPGKKPGKKC